MDKDKALDAALSQIEKAFGKGKACYQAVQADASYNAFSPVYGCSGCIFV